MNFYHMNFYHMFSCEFKHVDAQLAYSFCSSFVISDVEHLLMQCIVMFFLSFFSSLAARIVSQGTHSFGKISQIELLSALEFSMEMIWRSISLVFRFPKVNISEVLR